VARRARGPRAEAAGGNVAAAAAVAVPNHPPNCPRLETVSPVRVPKALFRRERPRGGGRNGETAGRGGSGLVLRSEGGGAAPEGAGSGRAPCSRPCSRPAPALAAPPAGARGRSRASPRQAHPPGASPPPRPFSSCPLGKRRFWQNKETSLENVQPGMILGLEEFLTTLH